MPRHLSPEDVSDFRERLCDVAARLFATHGPEAVTMRQLAAALGVSPMTPYRYFKDKDEILAAVRANGFDRFAQALELAREGADGPLMKARAVADAYFDFAFDNRQTYKLMFELTQPREADYPELAAASARARTTMSGYVRGLVASGELAGDPVELGMMFWAGIHGAVVLEMAGKLPPGAARGVHRSLSAALLRGLKPQG